ncbi:DUF6114 domain-containing protein [Halorientalis halophila]|uniref:DUF6114 domain-containing protein n=1 Tax=Halorientalis halophila TaxID=3108499 RepID=UPI00300A4CA2
MDEADTEPTGGPGERSATVGDRRAAFTDWRRRRPFWGGTLLVLSGLATLVLPVVFERFLLFTMGSFTGSALLFGASLVVCGLLVLTVPSLSSVLGGLGIVLATVSLFGALGGLVIGSVLGGLGGVLAFAWTGDSERGAEGEGRDGQ